MPTFSSLVEEGNFSDLKPTKALIHLPETPMVTPTLCQPSKSLEGESTSTS